MIINPGVCSLCKEEAETGTERAMFLKGLTCYVATIVSVRDILEIHSYVNTSSLKREVIHAIVLTTIWCIWKARNDKVFTGKKVSVKEVIDDIRSLSFLWVKNRA